MTADPATIERWLADAGATFDRDGDARWKVRVATGTAVRELLVESGVDVRLDFCFEGGVAKATGSHLAYYLEISDQTTVFAIALDGDGRLHVCASRPARFMNRERFTFLVRELAAHADFLEENLADYLDPSRP